MKENNIDKNKHPLEWLIQEMEDDPWYTKLGRWFRLQWWILYCLLFNNKLCRYFKYRKLEKRNPPGVLYGPDAKRFTKKMEEAENNPISTEERERIKKNFDAIMKKSKKEKLKIELAEYDYTGASNDIYGMQVIVNGETMPYHNMDIETILQQVLEYLGYEVEITHTLDR